MKKKKMRNKQGFTLKELMIAAGLVSLLVIAGIVVFVLLITA